MQLARTVVVIVVKARPRDAAAVVGALPTNASKS